MTVLAKEEAMKNYARYALVVTLSDTRREDPVYLDAEKAKKSALTLTKYAFKCVTVIDTAEDELVFRSVYGCVKVNRI